MSPHPHEDDLLDFARGVAADPATVASVRRHLDVCEACSARVRREEALSEGLTALARTAVGATPSEVIEARLVQVFREAAAAGRGAGPGCVQTVPFDRPLRAWLAAAAALVLIAGSALAWRAWIGGVTTGKPLEGRSAIGGMVFDARRPAIRGVSPAAWSDDGPASAMKDGGGLRLHGESAKPEFVAWPGSEALPLFDSGQLVRTELPASVLPLLGLSAPQVSARDTVEADIVVGQDGMARAVRLVR